MGLNVWARGLSAGRQENIGRGGGGGGGVGGLSGCSKEKLDGSGPWVPALGKDWGRPSILCLWGMMLQLGDLFSGPELFPATAKAPSSACSPSVSSPTGGAGKTLSPGSFLCRPWLGCLVASCSPGRHQEPPRGWVAAWAPSWSPSQIGPWMWPLGPSVQPLHPSQSCFVCSFGNRPLKKTGGGS